MKNFIIFSLIIIMIFSCYKETNVKNNQNIIIVNNLYNELLDEYFMAFSYMNIEGYRKISEKINEEHYLLEDGLKILKLNISILSIIGEYENAFILFNEYNHLFNNERELIIINGVLSYKIGFEYKSYFENIYEIIYNDNNKKETDLILLYILNIINNYQNQELKNELLKISQEPDNMKLLIEEFDKININDLIMCLGDFIGVILYSPIIYRENQVSNPNWWEDL